LFPADFDLIQIVFDHGIHVKCPPFNISLAERAGIAERKIAL